MIQAANTFPSLSYLHAAVYYPGECHPVVSAILNSAADVRRVSNIHRLLTGTYITQAKKAKFNQYDTNPSCLLCDAPVENREHILVICSAYKQEREEALTRIASHLLNVNLTNSQWTQLFLDCSTLVQQEIIPEDAIHDIYYHSRVMIAKIARKRRRLMSVLPINSKDKKRV